jgi:hypothetical protein
MSFSNRVSLDTNIIFLRDIFAFSTNNIPLSTNYVMAVASSGQVIGQDILRILDTYGVGYLPSTFSTIDGEINSVSQTLLSGVVTANQLTSSQNFLLSNICSVQSNVNVLSSYILATVLPSSFTSYNNSITSLNSSFQGYVAGASVTPANLFSTTAGILSTTNTQFSSMSTSIGQLSNTFVAGAISPIMFSNLSTGVSTQSNYFSGQIVGLSNTYIALSNWTRLNLSNQSVQIDVLTDGVSTMSSQVYEFGQILNSFSSASQNPDYVLGLLSTRPVTVFGSTIIASSLLIYQSTLTAFDCRVGINTLTPTVALDIIGSVNFTGALTSNGQSYGVPTANFQGLSTFVLGQSTTLQSVSDSLSTNWSNLFDLSTYIRTLSSQVGEVSDSLSTNWSNTSNVSTYVVSLSTSVGQRFDAGGGGAVSQAEFDGLSTFVLGQSTTIRDISDSLSTNWSNTSNVSSYVVSLSTSVGQRFDSGVSHAEFDGLSTFVLGQSTTIRDISDSLSTNWSNLSTLSSLVQSISTTAGTGGGGGTTNVLGTISAASQVWFGSNASMSTVEISLDLNVGNQNTIDSSALYSATIGSNNRVSGTGCIATGLDNWASSLGASAAGFSSFAGSSAALATGWSTVAIAAAATAMGRNTVARADYSFVGGFGSSNSATASNSFGYGFTARITGTGAAGFGYFPVASGIYSFSAGCNNTASGTHAAVFGTLNTASGEASFAAGGANTASGYRSFAAGGGNTASGAQASALGQTTVARADCSFVGGFNSSNSVGASNSFGYGFNARITGIGAAGFGYVPEASGIYSFSAGCNNTASGVHATAFGSLNTASGDQSFSAGYENLASGTRSFVIGTNNVGSAAGTYVEGINNIGTGQISHTEGCNNYTGPVAANAHAEGWSTVVMGIAGHAEGYKAIAHGNYSHAEGFNVSSIGFGSHAQGISTITAGIASHVEGTNNVAFGYASHAGGSNTSSIGAASFTGGCSTIATGDASFAYGLHGNALDIGSAAFGFSNTAASDFGHVAGVFAKSRLPAAATVGGAAFSNFAGSAVLPGSGQTNTMNLYCISYEDSSTLSLAYVSTTTTFNAIEIPIYVEASNYYMQTVNVKLTGHEQKYSGGSLIAGGSAGLGFYYAEYNFHIYWDNQSPPELYICDSTGTTGGNGSTTSLSTIRAVNKLQNLNTIGLQAFVSSVGTGLDGNGNQMGYYRLDITKNSAGTRCINWQAHLTVEEVMAVAFVPDH